MQTEVKYGNGGKDTYILLFKSDEEFYTIEENGKKPNTVRLFDHLEAGWVLENKSRIENIRVHLVEKKIIRFASFEREMTNISKIGEIVGKTLIVFSWRHEEK